jgi:hypothetical protein
MSKPVTHPDELVAGDGDDVIPKPPTVTAHVEKAKKIALGSQLKFKTTIELADFLNSRSGGKFVAIVFDNQVIVGPGDVHPDTVLQAYFEASDEKKPSFVVALPHLQKEVAPAQVETNSDDPLKELKDYGLPIKGEGGEPRADTPAQTRMPGAPPKFQGGNVFQTGGEQAADPTAK